MAEDTGAPDDTRAVGTPPEPEAPADPQEGPTGPAPADARPGKEAGQGSTADRDSDWSGRDSDWSDRATGRPDGETDWPDRDTGQPGRATDRSDRATDRSGRDTGRPDGETDWSGRDTDRPGRDTGRPDRATDRSGRDTGRPDQPGSNADQPDSNTDRPGPRAADIAREALRAARDDARRAREETEREGARRRRRARQSAVDDRAAAARRARDHGVGGAVRDVQELLSGAFRLPSLPDTTPDDRPDAAPDPREETAGHRSPSSPLADLPHGSTVRAPEGPDSAGSPGTPSGSSTDATTDATPAPNPTRSTPAPNPTPTHSTPRPMAAPHRDSDHRRTFPPFPAREGTTFAESWWGNAWVGALEQGALDAKRLERGRGYAEQGHVDAITVTPGLVLAYVRGSRPRPYRVQVRLRTLGDTDWDRFLDAAADRPGHIAALLDKEMPHSLADCGVPLLPGPGDLEPRCSCPDRGHPCKHAAALCYQTARLLDADPFVLLLLRGRRDTVPCPRSMISGHDCQPLQL
ncbi:SWIM zinc finger family protein, partial [Streptomyces olindensis]|uniref:SWIM zinc finger family protein n=1 Tax=Streptomyces olindensis TaxID=358823 RepID=UPI003F4D0457